MSLEDKTIDRDKTIEEKDNNQGTKIQLTELIREDSKSIRNDKAGKIDKNSHRESRRETNRATAIMLKYVDRKEIIKGTATDKEAKEHATMQEKRGGIRSRANNSKSCK